MNGLVIAAPRSGSGKTVITLGLLAALRARGIAVAPAKTGPDYIDPAHLARAAGRPALNLDPWAMSPARLRSLAESDADLLVVEGVMGLFDGAADGTGSTADLAATLGLPVILVLDCEKQSHSIAALVSGFANWRPDIVIAGLILNRTGSPRHETMLRTALAPLAIPILGAIPRTDLLQLPERHLGLVLPDEIDFFPTFIEQAAAVIAKNMDLDLLIELPSQQTQPGPSPLVGDWEAPGNGSSGAISASQRWGVAPHAGSNNLPSHIAGSSHLPPLAQHTAIARDAAFAFLYPHLLTDWHEAGATISFFSPLANQPPDPTADAVFLPGGYPELHAATLAAATEFKAGLRAARDRNALIYGECGGYMVLGDTLTDKSGTTHAMAGLLPISTRIDQPRRVLGYRRLTHASQLPWPAALNGHEFHYSSGTPSPLPPLFTATDALGTPLPPMGAVQGRVLGSYAHIIDIADPPCTPTVAR